MAEKLPNDVQTGRRILSPAQWWLSASAMFSLVIVPITVGIFYIMKVSKTLFDLPPQYSPPFGLLVGLALSLALGYFYSGMARKHAE